VVIDADAEAAAQIQESADALVITGNGATAATLREAGAAEADLLIAVTNADGVNVLACYTAKELGTRTTIARIEDPGVREGAERLGVDVVIDPSANAARELVDMFDSGGASEFVQFADGGLVMVGGIVAAGAPLTRGALADIRPAHGGWGWVVVAVVRDGETLLARRDTSVQPGDHAILMTTSDRVEQTGALIGLLRRSLSRVIVMGGTRLADLTGELLSNRGLDVVIVEREPERARRLAERHVRATVVLGDPTDPDLHSDLEVGPSDAVMALTGWDEVNVLSCLVARANGAGLVLARFHRIRYVALLSGVGMDAAISSRLMAGSAILRFVRRGIVEQVATFSDSAAEAIEIEVAASSPAVGKTLRELGVPRQAIVGGISRNGRAFIPDGSSTIEPGDHLIFVALPAGIEAATSLFAGR
jgi:trk system potassium uptake protein TrkA